MRSNKKNDEIQVTLAMFKKNGSELQKKKD